MSIKSGKAAYAELGLRLGKPPPETVGAEHSYPGVEQGYPYLTADLPDGYDAAIPGGSWVWKGGKVPQLRDPAAYAFPDDLRELLSKPPPEGLADDVDEAHRLEYLKRCIDVTMRGGTTSGVVYPLAVCELARWYRFRNIGGASAGAIAAAATAAAEVGRSSGLSVDHLSPEDRRAGHVRTGFPGLADCLAWLAQADDGGRDEFRVGQLFRPTTAALPLYRLVVAGMRRRYLAVPVLFAGAFGRVSKALNMLVVLCAAYAAGQLSRESGQPASRQLIRGGLLHQLLSVPLGLVALISVTLAAVGLVAFTVKLVTRTVEPPAPFREPLPGPKVASGSSWWAVAGLLIAGAAGCVGTIRWADATWWVVFAIWVCLLLSLLIVAVVSLLQLSSKAGNHAFGMVSGATSQLPFSIWNFAAGMPRRTVDRPLVTWLSETISELAGLPTDTPLLFGHLWFGNRYTSADRPENLDQVARDSSWRQTNLELVTTELVQGLEYRFPLLPTREWFTELYVRESDLERDGEEVFPPEVLAVLYSNPRVVATDLETGHRICDLHQIPDSADLPVIFAVRLSMSLPALLQAVPMYRISKVTSHVRDDFGLGIYDRSGPVRYPAVGPEDKIAQKLLFSDGGITSNFPLHLFDSPFPRWPTVGVNLGQYNPGFAAQDVWLPQDWEGLQAIGSPVRGGLVGFLMAIIGAARSWNDNAQALMPSFRGRVATVRQSANEGGNNLFMRRDTIAGLALRGEFAGARLRCRFRSSIWERDQWFRFRTTMGNLEQLRGRVVAGTANGNLALLAADAAARLSLIRGAPPVGDPDEPSDTDPAWFAPGPGCSLRTSQLLGAIRALVPADELTAGVPQPPPALRQVPRS
jgi:predicted acylesterase/phospholipase RssA